MPPPGRIVSLLPSATEILYGLGLGDYVVGVSHECDYPADAASKPRVTSSQIDSGQSSREIDDVVRGMSDEQSALYEVNESVLLDLRPQLIVTQAQCDVCAVRYQDVLDLVAAHQLLAATRVVALNPTSLDDVFDDILSVGLATDSVPAAQQYVANLRSRVDAVRSATAMPLDQRPRVACIEWTEPLMLAGNWMPQLVELAGGRHDLTVAGTHSGYTKWEAVIDYDPEVVVVMPCGFDLDRSIHEAAQLASLPDWDQLAAVSHQRIYAVDANAYFNRSGPRLIDSLELLAHLLHSTRFPLPPPLSSAWRAVS